MSAPTIFVESSLPGAVVVVGALAAVLAVVLGCCGLVNLVARRPVLNGWLWGAATVVFLVAYHLVSYYTGERAPAGETDPRDAGEAVQTTAGVLLLLVIAGWRAVAWRRRKPAAA